MNNKPVILLVDDQPQNIELFEAYLVPQGYEVVKAANGEEALAKLAVNQIDLILLDVMIPGIDGLEVTRRVRQDEKNRLLPVILVTALHEKEDRVKGIEAGCDDFISKPVDKMELLARVRSLLKVKAYNDLMTNYRKELESEVTNTTEKLKQSHMVLAEQNARLGAIINSPTDILIFSLDRNYCYTGFNENHRRAMKNVWQADIQIGMNLLDFMTIQELRDAARSSIHRALAGEHFQEVQHQQNMDIWFEFNWNPIRDMNGATVGVTAFIRDVTKRKHAEAELELRAQLLDAATDSIMTLGTKGNVIYFNEAAHRSRGYTREEMIGKHLHDLVSPEFFELISSQVDKMIEENGEALFETTDLCKDNSTVPVEVHSRIIRLGEQEYIVNISRDMTQHKQAEEAKRLSEENFQYSIEHSPVGIQIATEKRKNLYVNHAFLKMFGYATMEELNKVPSRELFTKESYTAHRERAEKIKRGEFGPRNYEINIIRKNGETRNLSVTRGEVLWNGAKQFQIIYEDITDIKTANEALQLSETKYRDLYENAPIAYYSVGLDYLIKGSNRAAQLLFGYSKEELIGKPNIELYEPECAAKMRIGTHHNKFEKGIPLENEERVFQRKDGSKIYALLSANPAFDEEGHLVASRMVVKDITEIKHVEEALRQSNVALLKTMQDTVQAMAATCELRDPYTAGHQNRVALLAVAVAEELHLSEREKLGLRVAAIVHDIGKMNIPAEILSKPGKLSQIEFELVKMHVQAGYDILRFIDFPWPVAQIVYQHHERMNGSGYPKALAGKDIIMEAKILVVADTVEAMVSHRPYRAALGIDKAVEEISTHRGILYDADVVDACLKVIQEKEFKF